MTPQEAVDHAAFAKNCEINQAGYSPLQLIMGQNPTFPGLAEVSLASTNLDSSSKAMRALKRIDEVRVKFRKYDCDEKLKKVRSQRINPCVERNYEMGDPVLFRDSQRKEWKQGTALIRFGKTLYLKFGNWIRRVPIDTVIPDEIGMEREEEGFIDPDENENEERFKKEESPVEELEKDLETAINLKTLQEKVNMLEEKLQNGDDKEKNEEKNNVIESDVIKQKRVERRKRQKLKKKEQTKHFPVLGQRLLFKEYDSETWMKAKVYGVFKKTSIYRNVKQMILENGVKVEKDFETEVEEWKTVDEATDDKCETEVTETFFLSSIIKKEEAKFYDAFPVEIISKKEYERIDDQEAMKSEIEKYKAFEAIEEVDDIGQKSVPIRWVVTKHDLDGKNQPIKARMCIRGDLENGEKKCPF